MGYGDGRLASELQCQLGAIGGGKSHYLRHRRRDFGVRGFLVALDQSTGKEVWRFWTTPARGSPFETWKGSDIDHSGAVAWFTGSYDPGLDTVFWQIGNPAITNNGDQRGGDNLYADCVVALDAKTGKLKWHYQFNRTTCGLGRASRWP